MDILNSINTALQNVLAKPTDSKPYRISDLLPKNWEGSNEKGQFRSFMSDLHLRMHAWSNQGEKMLVSVESSDKSDNSAIAFDCSDEEFRSIEASLYQILHRTTANEPLRVVQQTRGQKGFEAWHVGQKISIAHQCLILKGTSWGSHEQSACSAGNKLVSSKRTRTQTGEATRPPDDRCQLE